MKHSTLLATFLFLQGTYAHYAFSRLRVNDGEYSEDWQYIRKPKPRVDSAGEDGIYFPNFDPLHPRIRCGEQAELAGPNTSIATVNAGDHLSAQVWPRSGGQISHSGPGFFYLAKAPEGVDLKQWNGDGDWFKIAELIGNPKGSGLNDNPAEGEAFWMVDTGDFKSMNVTIPAATPPGKYLLRIEHLFLYAQYGMTNFFVECAQLDIKGTGSAKPGPTVKFPGAYDPFDEGIFPGLPAMGYPGGLKNYKPPGPPVWKG